MVGVWIQLKLYNMAGVALNLSLPHSLSVSIFLYFSLFLPLSLTPPPLPSLPLFRRLSSKKRKKFASQQQGSDGSSSSSSDPQQPSNSHSPMGSANGSPAVTSTTYTPPAFDKRLVGRSVAMISDSILAVLNMVMLHYHGIG